MNDDAERKGGQAGKVYGYQLEVPEGIQSGLTDVREQSVGCISEGFLHSIFSGLRRILGSWILVSL